MRDVAVKSKIVMGKLVRCEANLMQCFVHVRCSCKAIWRNVLCMSVAAQSQAGRLQDLARPDLVSFCIQHNEVSDDLRETNM